MLLSDVISSLGNDFRPASVFWGQRKQLPQKPGVYVVCDCSVPNGKTRYVGRTTNLRARLSSHHKAHIFSKLPSCFIYFQPLPIQYLKQVEKEYIERLQPDLNNSSVEA